MSDKPIVFISCVKSKRTHACRAEEMYISPLFLGMLAYAKLLQPKKIFILSAKYGLLSLEDNIEPYEKTLNNMPAAERKTWASEIIIKLSDKADAERDHFIFLAGVKYREHIINHIKNYSIPMKGMALGRQLQWLGKQLDDSNNTFKT